MNSSEDPGGLIPIPAIVKLTAVDEFHQQNSAVEVSGIWFDMVGFRSHLRVLYRLQDVKLVLDLISQIQLTAMVQPEDIPTLSRLDHIVFIVLSLYKVEII